MFFNRSKKLMSEIFTFVLISKRTIAKLSIHLVLKLGRKKMAVTVKKIQFVKLVVVRTTIKKWQ